MINQFLAELYKYRSINSLQKLKIIFPKYIKNNIKYIQIAGTNGKGSVSRLIHAILWQTLLDQKIGLFTSPHITLVNERIIVNNEMISNADLLRINEKIHKDVEKYQLGFFAILTLIALIYFQEQKVQWVILEVGIGGKYDTTNVIDASYAVITSIGKDHQDMLGNTKKAIVAQKLGIVKASTKLLFVSGNISTYLQQEIKIQGYNPIYSQKLVKSPYYEENKMLAITVVNKIFPTINLLQVINIINNTKISFRFEQYKINNKIIYFDAAHNIDGIKALVKALQINNIKPQQIIFSCLKNKYPQLLLNKLTTITNNIIVCKNNHILSIDGENFDFINMIKKTPYDIILITGSCYFLADVLNYLRINNSSIKKIER